MGNKEMMVTISLMDIYIGGPKLPNSKFNECAELFFSDWEKRVGNVLKLDDYSLSFEVEEGSLNIRPTITCTIVAAYIFLASYGEMSSGAKQLAGDIYIIHQCVFKSVECSYGFNNDGTFYIRKQEGVLVELEEILIKLRRDEITMKKAMSEIEVHLGVIPPELRDGINNVLKQAAQKPAQKLNCVKMSRESKKAKICSNIIKQKIIKQPPHRIPRG